MKKQDKMKSLLHEPTQAYELFHDETKIIHGKNITPKKSSALNEGIYYKAYARLPEIVLPTPTLRSSYSLAEALQKRHTSFSFSDNVMTKKKLSTLLYYAAGVHEMSDGNARRFYPSSGGMYPLEIYVLCLNTALPKGLYHYYVKNHSLEKLCTVSSFETAKYFVQPEVKNASCILFISAVFRRNTVKYANRGYRYILIEAGHLAQNMSLLAPALGLSTASIGGFYDNEVNKLLDLDNIKESVLYTVALG